ncbi:MAG: hypothetical protein BWZ10_03302 [candidate division BRC1 bacterium ADurb.BinA364]|nr:MAG: hypothetical protein BWZ10_03302 [candidate division BRC1 bacterium ADurb.BinA364]
MSTRSNDSCASIPDSVTPLPMPMTIPVLPPGRSSDPRCPHNTCVCISIVESDASGLPLIASDSAEIGSRLWRTVTVPAMPS